MKRLYLTYNGKKIASDSFNMKAWRVMFKILAEGEVTPESVDRAALEGAAALFDGTEITGDVLLHGWNSLDAGELDAALGSVFAWFSEVRPPDRSEPLVGTPPEDPVLAIYRNLLDSCGCLPSEVDRQCPQLLLDVMAADQGDYASVDGMTDDERLLYGF